MILVIGYGNVLRGDDGVGQQAALAVESWKLPNVQVRAVHQLLPELAEPLSHADLAIFVDAAQAFADADRSPGRMYEAALDPADARPPASGMAHTSSPESLLAMAEQLYGARPRAVMLSIPVERFEFGEALSPEALRGLAAVLRRIRALIDSDR